MVSILNHSEIVSKRFKRDNKFISLFEPQKQFYVELEKGIIQKVILKDDESIFTVISQCDSEEEFKKLKVDESGYGLEKVQMLEKRYRASQKA